MEKNENKRNRETTSIGNAHFSRQRQQHNNPRRMKMQLSCGVVRAMARGGPCGLHKGCNYSTQIIRIE